MKAQLLKQSVLKLAMDGSLTIQNFTDNAFDLLENIRDRKSKLIQDKVIKKEKHYPCDFEIEPFEIPDNWIWTTIGEISTHIMYGTSSKSSPKGDIPVLRMGNLKDGKINYDSLVYSSTIQEIEKYKLLPGDILFNRTNSRELVGKTALYNGEKEAIFAGYLIRFRPVLVLSEYINFVMQSKYYKDYCHSVRSDAIGQSNINAEKLKSFSLPLPPINEQEKIVQKITDIFDKIDTYESYRLDLNLLNTVFPNNLEKSILQYAVQGKLVEQDTSEEAASELLKRILEQKEHMVKEKVIKKQKSLTPITEEEIPFDIPDTWKWTRLGSIGFITSGGTPKTAVPEYWNGNITWITPSDMGKNKNSKYLSTSDRVITSQGLSNSSAQLIHKNSIVYSSRAPIGHINIMTTDYATNQGCKSFTPILVNIEYIYYALKVMTPHIQKKASGTTFKEISGTTFGSSIVPLPPLSEQSRIVEAIEKNMIALNKLKSKTHL